MGHQVGALLAGHVDEGPGEQPALAHPAHPVPDPDQVHHGDRHGERGQGRGGERSTLLLPGKPQQAEHNGNQQHDAATAREGAHRRLLVAVRDLQQAAVAGGIAAGELHRVARRRELGVAGDEHGVAHTQAPLEGPPPAAEGGDRLVRVVRAEHRAECLGDGTLLVRLRPHPRVRSQEVEREVLDVDLPQVGDPRLVVDHHAHGTAGVAHLERHRRGPGLLRHPVAAVLVLLLPLHRVRPEHAVGTVAGGSGRLADRLHRAVHLAEAGEHMPCIRRGDVGEPPTLADPRDRENGSTGGQHDEQDAHGRRRYWPGEMGNPHRGCEYPTTQDKQAGRAAQCRA